MIKIFEITHDHVISRNVKTNITIFRFLFSITILIKKIKHFLEIKIIQQLHLWL